MKLSMKSALLTAAVAAALWLGELSTGEEAFIGWLKTAIPAGLWIWYLQKSKRVRATFA